MVKRKGVYFATIVVVLAIIAGYAAASVVLSSGNQHASGNNVNVVGAVTGLTYASTILGVTTDPAPAASTGLSSATQAVADGGNAFCGNTCTAGDFSEEINYTFTTSMAGSVLITVNVAALTGGGMTTLYLKQTSGDSGWIVIYWDLGISNTLDAVTTTAQQCNGATSCP